MKFKDDIQQQIELDFNDWSDKAMKILRDAILKTDYLKTDRVIRCMVFLANADIDKLRQFIDNVLGDTTNGMLWAEVEKLGGALNDKRIREFKMTVDHCIVDVKE